MLGSLEHVVDLGFVTVLLSVVHEGPGDTRVQILKFGEVPGLHTAEGVQRVLQLADCCLPRAREGFSLS